ncbi:MAG: Npt1/Npt2 family nucleotide transporter [Myxococcota bacterium]
MGAQWSFFQDVMRVRPEEMRRAGLSFVYLFAIIGAFIMSRITRTVLFLEIPDYREQLPLTYIGVAVTVTLVMTLYARFERVLRRDITNMATLGFVGGVTLLFRFLLSHPHNTGFILATPKHEIYWAFYIWVEVLGTILIVQFWSLTSEVFTSRQAKRLFAVIGGGGVVANIVVGAGIRASVKHLGTENLLFVICGSILLAIISVLLLGRDARSELNAAKDRGPQRKSVVEALQGERVFAAKHVRLIAVVIVLTYVVSTLVDYQFNVVVGQSILGKDQRSAYYAAFFLYTGIIGGGVQFFLTARILERFGVLFALILLPLSMLLGSAGMLLVPFTVFAGLWLAALTKGSENVLRYTVNDSTLQLLYLPVPSQIRGRAKAIIDGIIKPVSIGGAGFLMALLVGKLKDIAGISLGFEIGVYGFSWIVVGLLLVWIVVLWALRREYLKSLVQTLQRRRLNFADADFRINDEETIHALEKTLASGGIGQILHTFELLPHVSRTALGPLNNKVADLLKHTSKDVRVAALGYLEQKDTLHPEAVEDLLQDASQDVRVAAIKAYCAMLRERSVSRANYMLGDYDNKVQAAAVAGLIRYGGLDGVLTCADLLKRWLGSDKPADRALASWVLGEVGVQNFYQPLIPRLEDESEAVRLAAIHAAGKLKNPELIEPLLAQLTWPRLKSAAVTALAGYGVAIESKIAKVLADETRGPQVRTQICKILGKLGDREAVSILCKYILEPNVHVRSAVTQALTNILQRVPGIEIEKQAVEHGLRYEAHRWYEYLILSIDLRLRDPSALLADALSQRQKTGRAQILALLGLLHRGKNVELVARNLRSHQPAIRANALEVLDNLLTKEEKLFVLPVFEEGDDRKAVETGREVFGLTRASRKERLKNLLVGGDTWLSSCAALEVGRAKLVELKSEVAQLLKSNDPLCRETAIVVLRDLIDKKSLCEHLEGLGEDPHPKVRHYAEFVIQECG